VTTARSDPSRGTRVVRWLTSPAASGPSAVLLLLTLTTGAVDAISVMALGEVFTSVMTANLALLGLGIGSDDPTRIINVAVALGGYVCGVLAAAVVATGKPRRGCGRWNGPRIALTGQLLLICGFVAGWLSVGGRPSGGTQLGLLAIAAVAMGAQSGVVRVAGAPHVSTTYLTGTLTGILTELVTTGKLQRASLVLVAMLPLGAALSGVLITWARPFAPLLPTGLLLAALLLAGARPLGGYRDPVAQGTTDR
jgi:uncharacterized membrane protein YoaK (UPF0700 family)